MQDFNFAILSNDQKFCLALTFPVLIKLIVSLCSFIQKGSFNFASLERAIVIVAFLHFKKTLKSKKVNLKLHN